MTNELRMFLQGTKSIYDSMEFKYIDHNDKKIINYTLREVSGIKSSVIGADRVVDLDKLIADSLVGIEILGCDIAESVYSIIKNTPFVILNGEDTGFACSVSYNRNFFSKERCFDPDSGHVLQYKVPEFVSEYSCIFLAHEHMHALKETNYLEYSYSQVVGDVIPMFYEFLMASGDFKTLKLVFRHRLEMIKENKFDFNIARMEVKKNPRDKALYKVLETSVGQYINSFYYACILFRMYQSEPKKVLEYVSLVLKHEMTTLEMLVELGIYGNDKNELFIEEIGNIRRLVK